MPPDLAPESVAARLAILRASYVPLNADEARALLEAADARKPFAEAVSLRLAELRALSDLTRYLHGARKAPGR